MTGPIEPKRNRDQLIGAIKHELSQRVWSEKLGPVAAPRYRSLFVLNPMSMWIYDVATLQILDVNRAALERYGYPRDEFLRLTIQDIRPPEDVPKFRELIADLPNFDRTGPWRHVLRDGTIIQVLITSHAVTYHGRSARLVLAEDLADEPELTD